MSGHDCFVSGVASLFEAREGELTFLMEKKFLKQALDSPALAYVSVVPLPSKKAVILVKDCKRSLAKIVDFLYPCYRGLTVSQNNPASCHPSATIHQTAIVGGGTVIEEGVCIMPYVVIGEHCVIKRDTVIYPNVTVYDRTQVGKRVVIHAGSVVGSDGYGYFLDKDEWKKVSHIGCVIIGDDVEIGANVCIDRGCLGLTRIGSGTKIDNLVHIAHNVKIGKNCIITGQVGFLGGAELEDHVIVGGQAGIGAVKIGKNAIIATKAGVTKNCPPGETWSGFPAWSHSKERKKEAWLRRQQEGLK